MIQRYFAYLLVLLLYVLSPVQADDTAIHELSAPELKQLLTKQNVTLVNVLSEIEYQIQHIPGSINVPVVEMENTEKLPEDKNAALIFYCLSDR